MTRFVVGLLAVLSTACVSAPPTPQSESPCAFGGPGSVSCKITADGQTCAATCQPGYYACCQATKMGSEPPTCTCLPYIGR